MVCMGLAGAILPCLLVAIPLRMVSGHVQQRYPYYHTSDEIHAEVVSLAASCAVPFTFTSESCGESCSIDIVDIGSVKDQRVFYIFGEHARELISPETALVLMQELCSRHPSKNVQRVLETTQFRIIPNGNPSARRLVESGQFCLRSNTNGVDLNRNWDAHWTAGNADELNSFTDQLNPGKAPFSEPETKIFRHAVAMWEPEVFVSVHSGTLGMYMPWAYSEDDAGLEKVRNGPKMKSVLSELDSRFCQCPSGAAAKEVGYDSPGTCLDWVHANTNARYSYAFEIFTGIGTQDLRDRYLAQRKSFKGGKSSLLQLDEAADGCFLQFNPETRNAFESTVVTWSNALVELAILTQGK